MSTCAKPPTVTSLAIKRLQQLIYDEDTKTQQVVTASPTDPMSYTVSLITRRATTPLPTLSEEEIETITATEMDLNRVPTRTRRLTKQMIQNQKSMAEDELNRIMNFDDGDRLIQDRILVLEEIISSERAYVQFLDLLYDMYYAPLCEGKPDKYKRDDGDVPGISEDAKDLMFPPNFTTIANINKKFLEKLEERWESYSDIPYFITIGDIYAEMAPFLKVYVSFVTNFERSVKFIKKHRQSNPQFDLWLDRRKKHPDSNGLDLMSLLIMPVQRVPRYPILINALLDKTNVGHLDYNLLREAGDAVSSVAEYQNARVRESKNCRRVHQISKKCKMNSIVSPSRRIIKEGRVVVRNSPMSAYLFNDLLVLDPNDKRGQFQIEVFSLIDCFIAGGDEYSVTLSITESESTSEIEIHTETYEDKQQWFSTLTNVLSALRFKENDLIIRHVDDPGEVSTVSRSARSNSMLRQKLNVRSPESDWTLTTPRLKSGSSISNPRRFSITRLSFFNEDDDLL
ncbi:hypothetical protein AKO1_013007 [Acrasis kona]|uniref:DH domain-containing protein n=1 Tax=Acrasis kona TaxID=1008807 RepID=A0AAW2YXQ5_9EUKA